jgi:tetratricopeptide (TPR) repeat protein
MAAPVEIFCCYSRKDQQLLLDLRTHLMPLQRQGYIKLWADTDISAGTDWEKEITKHLNTAQIILLLISPDFMNSDYCYSKEMTRAIERHEQDEARVIPIIVRPVLWQGAPFGKLQALPTDAKAVTSRYWPNPDEALFDVAEGIYRAIQEVTASLQARSEINPSQEIAPPKASIQTPIQDTPPKQAQKTKEQWLEEGNRLCDLKQYSEALTAYEQAIGLDPNYALAYNNKGTALERLNRKKEAQQAYEKARQLGYTG